jgi:hypothetical protein
LRTGLRGVASLASGAEQGGWDVAEDHKPTDRAEEQTGRSAEDAAERFVEGVLARGEAAEADADGKLPPGATHEIVGYTKDGKPKLRRRRFSIT